MLIESLKSLHSVVQLLHRENEFVDVILQEQIKTEYDVRVIVASGQIVGAIKRPIVSDDFRSNVSQGSEPTEHELTDLEISETLRAAKAVDGTLVGVDFIPSKNRNKDVPYMIEVNSAPGLIGIEEALRSNKKSITTKILKIFMNRDNWSIT